MPRDARFGRHTMVLHNGGSRQHVELLQRGKLPPGLTKHVCTHACVHALCVKSCAYEPHAQNYVHTYTANPQPTLSEGQVSPPSSMPSFGPSASSTRSPTRPSTRSPTSIQSSTRRRSTRSPTRPSTRSPTSIQSSTRRRHSWG